MNDHYLKTAQQRYPWAASNVKPPKILWQAPIIPKRTSSKDACHSMTKDDKCQCEDSNACGPIYLASSSSRLPSAAVNPDSKPISMILCRSASEEKVISTVTFVPAPSDSK